MTIVVTCDDCGVTANPPPNPKMNTRDQLRDTVYPNTWLTRNLWYVSPNGNNHRCPECTTRHVSDADDYMPKRAFTKGTGGKTKCGVDMWVEGEATHVILMNDEMGTAKLAEAMGVAVSTISHIVRNNNTGGREGAGVRKIYDLAAEALMLRAELTTKNEMLDRAQDRANRAEQQLDEFSTAAANLRVQNATMRDKNEALERRIEELTERNLQLEEHNLTLQANQAGNVVPPVSLKEAIKSYFNRNAFQLTMDDLAMLDKTLRQVGTEE